MKYLFLVIAFITPIGLFSEELSNRLEIEQRERDVETTDIGSTSIKLSTLEKLVEHASGPKKAKIRIVIDALKNLQMGRQPSTAGLSDAQRKVVEEVFVLSKPEESEKRQSILRGKDSKEKLKNIQSFDEFKKVAMKIINGYRN